MAGRPVFALAIALTWLGSSSLSIQAAIITSWNTTGLAGNEASVSPATSAAHVTGLDLTRGAGLSASAGGDSLNSSGWNDLAADDYLSLGFTVESGYAVDLASLRITTRSSGSGPGQLGLFSSVDGFTSSLATITQSGTANTDSIIDLTSLSGLAGTVELRIFALNTTSANNGTVGSAGTFRVQNYPGITAIDFSGTVSQLPPTSDPGGIPAPEPSTLAVMAAGLLALATSRRRRSGAAA